MKETSLFNFIQKNIENEYAMDVFYYTIKKSIIERDFSLSGTFDFHIDGRFFGDTIRIYDIGNQKTPLHSFALLLSLQLLMRNHKYIKLCNENSLIFVSKPQDPFLWIHYISLIYENWDNEEVKRLYGMMDSYYYDKNISEEDKDDFKNSIVKPVYKNERTYYQKLAQSTIGVSEMYISNNAFLEAPIKQYTIPKEMVYVGNTAFAYCEKLESLVFEGKVMFGLFPIIECENLRKITVPTELLLYYKDCLPYYKNIITDGETLENEITPKTENRPIDIDRLGMIFDKKATSYKYFWFISIISLAKENGNLKIPYKDIVIRMASLAWPMVFGDEINLGNSDMMAKYLEEILRKTVLIESASRNVVEKFFTQHYKTKEIGKSLAPLLKNVPYRFLSPWIKFTTNEDVEMMSRDKKNKAMYALYSDFIVFDEDWWNYLNSHYSEICDFAMRSFLAYLKKNNSDFKLTRVMINGWF